MCIRLLTCRMIIAVALAAAPMISGQVYAQDDATFDGKIAFDISEQPLDGALARYFEVTGVQLLYDSTVTQGLRSAPVRGNLTSREALRAMLKGTGLIARYSRSRSVFILPASGVKTSNLVPLGRVVVREQAPQTLSTIAKMAYYDQVEDTLRALLEDDARTSRLNFKATIEISVDASGRIDSIRINKGTGRTDLDQKLISVLNDATISPPPQGMAQPLTVNVVANRKHN